MLNRMSRRSHFYILTERRAVNTLAATKSDELFLVMLGLNPQRILVILEQHLLWKGCVPNPSVDQALGPSAVNYQYLSKKCFILTPAICMPKPPQLTSKP
jgi:hypothetical protein